MAKPWCETGVISITASLAVGRKAAAAAASGS